MPQSVAARTWTNQQLRPYLHAEDALQLAVNLPPSVTYSKGQILAQVSASASCVQTLAISGTPTGGTFTLSGVNPLTQKAFTTAAIAYNAATSAVQTALTDQLGAGTVTVTGGGALPGNTHTLTFGGSMANMPIATLTSTNSLTGGSSPTITITRTTVGQTAGTFTAVDASVNTPAGAPTVAGNGAGSAFAAGTYAVSYTLVTAYGESTPSAAANVTLTAAQNIRVSAISSLDASVTKVRYYVNGVVMAETVPSSGTAAQTDITGSSITVTGVPPTVNTAYKSAAYNAKAILVNDCATDAYGNITVGSASGGGEWSETEVSTPASFSGCFKAADLTGLTAAVLDLLGGRVISGSISSGVVHIP